MKIKENLQKLKEHPFYKRSIAWKLFANVLLCLLLLLLVNWLLNTFVLVSYYRNEKQKVLKNAFNTINTMYSQSPDKVNDELLQLSNDNNIRILIWNDQGPIFDSRFFNYNNGDNRLFALPSITEKNGTYEIGISKEQRTGSSTIMLTGRFNNSYYVTMSTPIAAIQESVGITNRFLLFSGAFALLISLAMVLFVTRSFIRPIKELSRVAGSVARLDFTDRYTGGGNDEFAQLGSSINTMASALEETISNIKSANLQLISDNEQITKQNEARRAFIANISHELKTPISLIQTYAEGLKEDIASGAENRDFYCEVIEDEANKMSMLIKKMTMLMQLQAGNEELVIERFDITELIHNLLLKNQPRFEQKHVKVEQPSDKPVYVLADDFLIENVLSNYISNALNHVNENGTIAVTYGFHNNRVRISVLNSGSHIPESDLSRIWESFYKVDKARTRAYGGTGIGLSVVAAIMNAHHMPYGVINHDNGVEFYIELESH